MGALRSAHGPRSRRRTGLGSQRAHLRRTDHGGRDAGRAFIRWLRLVEPLGARPSSPHHRQPELSAMARRVGVGGLGERAWDLAGPRRGAQRSRRLRRDDGSYPRPAWSRGSRAQEGVGETSPRSRVASAPVPRQRRPRHHDRSVPTRRPESTVRRSGVVALSARTHRPRSFPCLDADDRRGAQLVRPGLARAETSTRETGSDPAPAVGALSSPRLIEAARRDRPAAPAAARVSSRRGACR